ncbi:MAG: glycosyltransferase family 2 protein [Thermoleophilia bacterium]|nr:glycosyltransferase family 2 protein [Thermoleophilia bacterium]
MNVAAVVVSHGHAADVAELVPLLRPQVEELVVVANVPGSVGEFPPDVRVLENERPRGYAANANRGIAETRSPYVVVANPDTRPHPDAVTVLAEFAAGRPRCGIAGPELRYPDGRWQPARRRFPTVGGTLVRRTPLRALFPPLERQRDYYLLDERPSEPVEADWLLGAFLLLRREMVAELGGFDPRFRLYGEDIDLAYRAAKAGWERWHVPGAVVVHAWSRASDSAFLSRRTLWHWRSVARFARKHPERLRALR